MMLLLDSEYRIVAEIYFCSSCPNANFPELTYALSPPLTTLGY